jgi:hypothetical protein
MISTAVSELLEGANGKVHTPERYSRNLNAHTTGLQAPAMVVSACCIGDSLIPILRHQG